MPYVDLNTIHNPSASASPPPAWGDGVRDNFEYFDDLLQGIAGTLTFGTWTPTVSQGASTNISKTTVLARYVRIGNLVVAWFYLAVTGSGSAGSGITITPPVNIDHVGGQIIGASQIYDASAVQRYVGCVEPFSTSALRFITSGNLADFIGAAPSFALASGDQIQGFIIYKAA